MNKAISDTHQGFKLKSIVTGAAGFIGSHLTDFLLSNGHEVLGVDNLSTGKLENLTQALKNPSFRFEHIDLSSRTEVDLIKGEYDFIFHLGALAEIVPSIQDPDKYFESNVLGTYNMCQKARDLSIRKFVYAASSSCYGIPMEFPTPETSKIELKYPYALTKYLGEKIVLHWGEVFGLPVISLRLFNVYGTRSRTSVGYGAVMGVFLAQMLANEPLTIVGDGEQTRDFTFINDVVLAFFLAATSDKENEIYNVGSGKSRKVIELAQIISKERRYVFVPKRPGEPEVTFADISKISKELKWNPSTTLEEGLSIILESKSDWKDAPVWTPESISKATADWFKYLGSPNG